ncbi:hypothetical protein BU23DRAFT_403345, partial [Bimuria novae-zelandiae CBS 107.79]
IPSDVDWDAVSKAIGMELIDDAVLEKRHALPDRLHIPEVLWDLLPSDARFGEPSLLDWPASTGRHPGSRYNLPPQSLWALETARLKSMRTRQTRKKLAIQEVSICLLIHNLLFSAKAGLASPDALASLSPHIASVAHLSYEESQSVKRDIIANRTALETTKLEDWPEDTMTIRTVPKFQAEPDYMQDVDGDFHHIAQQLNTAIKNIFDEYQDKRIYPDGLALAIAKICHNLLISSAAPNLQTFNILLTGFQKWKRHSLVNWVIEALDDCKIRPNEITCAAILDYYTERERPDDFSRFVALMRGASDALMLAKPDIAVNEAGEGRLVRVSETKVYQKVYPTPTVFNSLMHGVLKFAGFDRAMDIYYEMKEDGWGLDMVGLSCFLDDCMHRADWQGGLAVWEEISSIRGRIKPDLLAKAYAQFLTLCSIAQKPAAFNSVLEHVVKCGYDRKAVLTSFREFSHAVRQKQGYLAPAWTADNLLIAVSDYMKDGESTEANVAPFFEEMNGGPDSDSPAPPGPSEPSEPPESTSKSTTDPWDAWLEHELG